MRPWVFLPILLLFAGRTYAQSIRDTLGYHLLVKAELTCYIPSSFPYLDVEAEIPLGKKNGLVLAGGPIVGIKIPSFINGKTADSRQGYIVNPAIKHYIRTSDPHNNQRFVSLDVLFRWSTFRVDAEMILPGDPSQQVFQEKIMVQHQAWGYKINFGQMIYFGHFGLEVSVGIGNEFMQHSYSGTSDPRLVFTSKKFPPFWEKPHPWNVRFPSHIRVFYRF
jgi:hypothetical protein